jgi:ribosomal protein L37AE/L43A
MAMAQNSFAKQTERPSQCPFCRGRVVDTLAKVFTPTTMWRCLSCEKTWTDASLKPPTLRP